MKNHEELQLVINKDRLFCCGEAGYSECHIIFRRRCLPPFSNYSEDFLKHKMPIK